MTIHAILRNVTRVGKGDDVRAPCLYGQIYGDSKGRFSDGSYVTTSTIMEERGSVFTTRNTTYMVESWADEKPAVAADLKVGGVLLPQPWEFPGYVAPANDNPAPYSHASAINLFAADCHAASRKAGWYTNLATGKALDRNVPEMLCLIHSEISEAMEGYRKNLQDDKLPARKMIEVELADALIRIGDLATFLGCDLGGAAVEKMEFNAVREDHKIEARKAGGKAF